jgi:hypothetical protein
MELASADDTAAAANVLSYFEKKCLLSTFTHIALQEGATFTQYRGAEIHKRYDAS